MSKKPNISKSHLIALGIVGGVIVGGIVVSLFLSGTDDAPPTVLSTTTAPLKEDPPWYNSDGSGDGTVGGDELDPIIPDSNDPDPGGDTVTDPADPQDPDDPQNTEQPEDTDQTRLSCDKIASFSGKFIEDGTDVPAENVAALLVTNNSDQFLDLANIVYVIDGQQATFVVTGLPAGKSVWVMEYTKLTVTGDSKISYVGCTTSFREDAVATGEEVTVKCEGDTLYATNNTDRTLENVLIYYKCVHTDGNYFGGITYMVEFGSIAPGKTIEKLGGHFVNGESEIVRIGWQESQTE